MSDVFGNQDKSRLPSSLREQRLREARSGDPLVNIEPVYRHNSSLLICLIDADVREEARRKPALFYRAAACFRRSY